jgi:hypothetical protein
VFLWIEKEKYTVSAILPVIIPCQTAHIAEASAILSQWMGLAFIFNFGELHGQTEGCPIACISVAAQFIEPFN